ncbi:LacI family DNA-binding transcriptional regulator [Microbacterium sp. F51-2R]|uniref:LacI family DNA-binding transcriptional regulator n=1 Tax=Microbacterium sp. F51-2R TaxID=3445777 RepID=UPI003FA03AF7
MTVEPTQRAVTSADVARASGVSRATVSYVLNDRTDKRVSAATRALVLETARQLGHVPNSSARALRTGSSTVILALVPSFSVGAVFEQMLEHLGTLVAARGYALLLHRLRPAPDAATALRELWSHVNPSAIAVLGGGHPPSLVPALERISIAPVTTDTRVIDHRRIGYLQARHMISLGHERLAFAAPTSPDLETLALQRFEGTLAACAEHGVPAPQFRPVATELDRSAEVLTELTHGADPVTAVCCYNDDVAARVLLGAQEVGLPDLSIIGVDNTSSALLGVSTIAIDTLGVASALAADLLDRRPPSTTSDQDAFCTIVDRRPR